MPDNIVDLPVITTLKSDPNRVLQAADGKLETAVVIGWQKDDSGQFYFASSEPNSAEVIMLLEIAKRRLLESMDELSEE